MFGEGGGTREERGGSKTKRHSVCVCMRKCNVAHVICASFVLLFVLQIALIALAHL